MFWKEKISHAHGGWYI